MDELKRTAPPRIDSHQHFWEYDPSQYPWIQPGWPIRKSFLPSDLKPLLDRCGFNACIAVQARQTLEETIWLLELAKKHSFISGVVGWVNLLVENEKAVADQLERFDRKKLVGVRHVVQDELDDRFMLRSDFQTGIRALQEYGLAYDLLVFPKQLPAAIQLARKFPEQPFVLDHIAKPPIESGVMAGWRDQIRELAKEPNVFCKLSGMVTEARWSQWAPADFRPYLDVVWEAFGEDRLMIGSDWPVCLLSAEYEGTMKLVTDYLRPFPTATQAKILGANAARFYKLNL
jgi:L-fuconolactonase